MQNLNKENFWNALEEKYPMAMQKFKGWIDAYKKEVNWNGIFSGSYIYGQGQELQYVKFHHIPIEMQLGIILRFVAEATNDLKSYNDLMNPEYLGQLIESAFEQIEK